MNPTTQNPTSPRPLPVIHTISTAAISSALQLIEQDRWSRASRIAESASLHTPSIDWKPAISEGKPGAIGVRPSDGTLIMARPWPHEGSDKVALWVPDDDTLSNIQIQTQTDASA